MNNEIYSFAASCYGITLENLKRVYGGTFNEVYEFTKGQKDYVIRITPPNDEIGYEEACEIIKWLKFLDNNGASIARPILSKNNNWVETIKSSDGAYLIAAYEKAPGILGRYVPIDAWNEDLCRKLGQSVGRLHVISEKNKITSTTVKRPIWDTIGNEYNVKNIDNDIAINIKKNKILKYVYSLPKDNESYGMIHTNLTYGNSNVDVKNQIITFFDFDDCSYGWYVMDIAYILQDTGMAYGAIREDEFIKNFVLNFLRGYITEKSITQYWLSQIPYFINLIEIGIYSALKGEDVSAVPPLDRFMKNRKENIENDIPYLNIDFDSIMKEL